MKDKMHQAFDEVRAGDELKENTLLYLRQYDQKPEKLFSYSRRVFAVACLAVFLAIGGGAYRVYFMPASYLDIDVNPSIEVVVNRFGRVIDAFAYNEDGEMILEDVDIRHKSYENALRLVVETIEDSGYFADNRLLSVTVQSKKKENEILNSIEKQISDILDSGEAGLVQEIYAVDEDTHTHAHETGVSPAKYLAILDLLEVDSSATVEECQDHSISELREYTNQHRERHRGKKRQDEEQEDHHNETQGDDSKKERHGKEH